MSTEIELLTDADTERYFKLWEHCFGDSLDTVEEFHKCFGDDLRCLVLKSGNEIMAELSLFQMGKLTGYTALEGRGVLVSYAICTDARSRNKGLGSEITEYARTLALNEGFVSALSPADNSLIEFYENLQYKSFFREEVFQVEASEKKSLSADMIKISADDYDKKREKLLAERLHIKLSDRTLRYVQICSGNIGLWSLAAGKIICACDDTGDKDLLEVTELLTDETDKSVIENIMSEFTAYLGKKQCIYHMPADSNDGKVQAMISLPIKEFDLPNEPELLSKVPWFGFPFA